MPASPSSGLSAPPQDPLERWIPFGLRLIPLGLCALMLWQAADATWSFPPRHFPFFFGQWYVWIITPLHEAGHLLSMPFGRILMILGGSLWQVAIPLILAGVALRQRSYWTSVYTSLAGIHLVALNPYIYDAPYRSLPLLGGRKEGHDWYNLLVHWQSLDASEDLAMLAYVGGIFISLVGIIGGVLWTTLRSLRPQPEVPPQ
ncbi:MAG: hypothetical protein AABY75_08515 [Bacteroidota bacterium]